MYKNYSVHIYKTQLHPCNAKCNAHNIATATAATPNPKPLSNDKPVAAADFAFAVDDAPEPAVPLAEPNAVALGVANAVEETRTGAV